MHRDASDAEFPHIDRFMAAEPNDTLVASLVGGLAAVGVFEMVRSSLVNLESDPFHAIDASSGENVQPVLNVESTPPIIREPLIHSGDMFEGYCIAAATFTALAAVRLKRLNNRSRSIAAGAVATGLIAWHELFRQATPDPADIPAGMLGAGIVMGLVHLLSKDGSGRQPKTV